MKRRFNFLSVIVLIIFLLLIDLYVFLSVEILAQAVSLDSVIKATYWIFSLTLLTLMVAIGYSALAVRKITRIFTLVFNIFLAVFASKLVIVLVLLGEDAFRIILSFVQYLYRLKETNTSAFFVLHDRFLLVSELAFFLAVACFSAFSFGVTRGKYHYKVHRKVLYFDELPENFDGFTITQISDIHSGSFNRPQAVQRGVDLAKNQHSDLFVFTGDLVNHVATEIEPFVEMFRQIRAPYGQFSIVGNHDYGDYVSWKSREEKAENFRNLIKYHEKLGYRLLLDEHVKIEKNGQYITLLGVHNWGKGFGERGDLQKALRGVESQSFKILLSHDPSHWDYQVKNNPLKIHLTLSGHTHGMQFGIEFLGFKWSPVKYRYHNWAGLTIENDRALYVNRGFGFHGFSGRIGIWPEVTVITLKRTRG